MPVCRSDRIHLSDCLVYICVIAIPTARLILIVVQYRDCEILSILSNPQLLKSRLICYFFTQSSFVHGLLF